MTTSSIKKSTLNFLTLLPLAFALTAASIAVQAQTLQLNGSGIRHQAASPLYSAGLYLDQKRTTTEEVMGSQGAKQLRVVMLRDVSAAEMGDLLASGIVANASDDELRKLIPTLFSIGKMLGEQKKLVAGDSFQIESQPAAATTITIDAKAQGRSVKHVFAQPDLFGTLLRIWLGNQPADAGLKTALLGKAG